MQDHELVAFLAASTEREMRTKLAGSSDLAHNRTDYRRYLNGQPPAHLEADPRNIPQQGNYQPNYPQQQPHPNYNPNYNPNNLPTDPHIPNGLLPTADVPLLRSPYGPPQGHLQQQDSINNSFVENTGHFQVPDYSNSKKYLEDEQEFRDALIKEIKGLKTLINKLNRESKATKLIIEQFINPSHNPAPAEPESLDATTAKS